MDAAEALRWAREELVRQVEIPSYSDREHEIVDYLEGRLAELDLPARRQPVEGSADNLVVDWGRPELLLTAHVDTIVPDWPWDGRARVEGTKLYGLGAQDDKGCAVAAMLAFLLAREQGLQIAELPVGIGLCVDEEVGGKGSIAMAEELRPAMVVGLEGTELQLGLAEAGFAEFWVHVSGRAVHGALREEGDNAVHKAIAFAHAMLDAPFVRHEHALLGRNLPMVWEFNGGRPVNVVPDGADLHVDVRVTPGGPSAADVLATCSSIAERFDGEVEVVEVVEPFACSAEAPLAAALARAAERSTGRRPGSTGMLAWTDAHSFVDLAGSDAVVYGPGHLRHAHRPDEHVDLVEVVECARTLAVLLAESPAIVGASADETAVRP